MYYPLVHFGIILYFLYLLLMKYHEPIMEPQPKQAPEPQVKDNPLSLIQKHKSTLASNLQQIRHNIHETSIFEENYFSAAHPKTLIVQEFLKNLNQQKARFKKKMEAARSREEKLKVMQEHQQKQELELRKKERQEKIARNMEKKKIEKEKMEQEVKARMAEYNRFIKQQPVQPLYVQKEREFMMNQVVPEILRKELKIGRIKSLNRPIDVEDLNMHEEEYLKAKKEKEDMRIKENYHKQIELQEMEPEHYRGKFRYLVLQEMLQRKLKEQEDPKEEERIKKARRILYAERVRAEMAPKPSPKNKEELSYRIRERNMSKSMDVGAPDPKKDGLQNLNHLHQMIRKQKPLVQKSNNGGSPVPRSHNTIDVVRPRNNTNQSYLEDIRRKRLRMQDGNPVSKSERITREIQNLQIQQYGDYDKAKRRLYALDAQAERKNKEVRNATHKNALEKLQEKSELDQQYLAAIKAKINLLNVK